MSQQELDAEERGWGGLTQVIHPADVTQLIRANLPNPPDLRSIYLASRQKKSRRDF